MGPSIRDPYPGPVEVTPRPPPPSTIRLSPDNNDRRPRPSAAAAAGLSFLPGIIVQGHEWYFIAVTRAAADGHTQRWEKVLIGSMQ
ncbi:hypothetical protein CSUB01_11008 [Colletotrichum sublineola]|uniref:PD-(D/E)XK nuclease-like domain-containing protein n=1 Tax=Colletotrichum sublineola TaxID=1173701 RepID=A0A066XX61_COLSU|nr:hypothetical protein CSUB01_11008 [Colletotrichum sublineola]